MEDLEGLALFFDDFAVRGDQSLDRLDEEAAMRSGDRCRVEIVEPGRPIQPLLNPEILVLVELEPANQARDEDALFRLDLEIRPRKRTDELDQAESFTAIELVEHVVLCASRRPLETRVSAGWSLGERLSRDGNETMGTDGLAIRRSGRFDRVVLLRTTRVVAATASPRRARGA